jgi:hypothetical protein
MRSYGAPITTPLVNNPSPLLAARKYTPARNPALLSRS